MSGVRLDLSQPERRLRELGRALRAEEDGKQLKKELVSNIRSAAQPARQAARAAIRSAPSQGPKGRSIRSAIAQKIQVTAKVSGRAVGARVVANTVKLRGFTHAPRRFNSTKGWRHPVPRADATTHQVGKPDWFDDAVSGRRREYRAAVIEAMDKTADRIARRI